MVDTKSARPLNDASLPPEASGVFLRGPIAWSEAIPFAVHDARNHLMVMLSGIDDLREMARELGAGAELFAELDAMRDSGKQIALLLGEMSACARHDLHEVVDASQDLGQLIEESARALRRTSAVKRGIAIAIEGQEREVMVADGRVLRRVVDNLLLWGIDQAPFRSTVTLSWSTRDDSLVLEVCRDSLALGRRGSDRSPVSELAFVDDQACLGMAYCRAVARSYGGELAVSEDGKRRKAALRIPMPVGATAGVDPKGM